MNIDEARSCGATQYDADVPCKNGHIAKRYTSNSCCVECSKIQRRKFTKGSTYKQLAKHWRRYTKYGLNKQEFETMLTNQKGLCKICSSSFELPETKICVDHCHTTGLVRGLLCNTCNIMLGMAKDDVSILMQAIKYLHDTK